MNIETKVIREEREFICCSFCDGVDAIEIAPGEWRDCPECEGRGGYWQEPEKTDAG